MTLESQRPPAIEGPVNFRSVAQAIVDRSFPGGEDKRAGRNLATRLFVPLVALPRMGEREPRSLESLIRQAGRRLGDGLPPELRDYVASFRHIPGREPRRITEQDIEEAAALGGEHPLAQLGEVIYQNLPPDTQRELRRQMF